MGVDLQWIDENGKSLRSVLDPSSEFARLLDGSDLSNTLCLRFIDRYADTIFNQLQAPVLHLELMELASENSTGDTVRNMLALIHHSIGKTHTCLKFVGD